MPKAYLKDGKLLLQDGKVQVGDDCVCCDCPECPPLASLPQLCYLKITPPASQQVTGQSLVLYLVYTGSYGSRPQWTKETISGQCYYTYSISLEMPCCISACTDNCTIPLDVSTCGPWSAYWCCDEECGTECLDGTVDLTITGNIKAALRDVISDAYATVQYRYNCDTGVIERKVSFEYFYSQQLKARFVGTISYDYTAGAEQPECCDDYPTQVVHYNDGTTAAPTNACGSLPYFPDMDDAGGESFDHEVWMNPTSCFTDSATGQVEYTEDWTTVGSLFASVSLTPNQIAPTVVNGLHRCDNISPNDASYEVSASDPSIIDFECPVQYTKWYCDDANQTMASEACTGFPGVTRTTYIIDDPFVAQSIDFVTTSDLALSACQEWTDVCQPANDGEM